jgi:hypothetical protein
MTKTNDSPGLLGDPTLPATEKDEAAATLLRAENARLHEHIKQLQEDQERDRQTIATLQAERDAYRRALYAWALEQITDEDLQRYAQNEDGLPLDDFIGELDPNAKVSRDA